MRGGLSATAISPRPLAAALLALAGTVLLAAFVVICVRTGTLSPWNVVVHEDGQRTLLLTILYFEHATRELPLDILLAIAIGGGAFFAFPREERSVNRAGTTGRAAVLAWTAASVVLIIVAGTALEGGVGRVLDNLLQHHTRAGAALLWGSHWRYHLLERIALILVCIGFAGVLRFSTGDRGAEPGRVGLVAAAGSVGVYAVLTLVFSAGLPFALQPFRDPQYLGHQARELFTHGLVTVPVGWSVCMLAGPGSRPASRARSPSSPTSVPRTIPITMIAGAVGVLLGAYVGVAALLGNAVAHGQTKDLAMLIFPHFFEHSFTYVVVPVVAALVYEMAAKRSLAGVTDTGPFVPEARRDT